MFNIDDICGLLVDVLVVEARGAQIHVVERGHESHN